ncbi:unnamed protein product, partial [marine sediment metagenome]
TKKFITELQEIDREIEDYLELLTNRISNISPI